MITLQAIGNSVKFTFSDNDRYLQDGTIEVPKNSLLMLFDESGMVTFKKAASNDIFLSANLEDLGMTRAELETFYKENMVGAAGGGDGTYDGYSCVKMAERDYDTKPEVPFYVTRSNICLEYNGSGEHEWDDFACIQFDYDNKTYTIEQEEAVPYICAEYVESVNAFKIFPLQEGHDITRCMDEYGYIVDVLPSGTTSEGISNLAAYTIEQDEALDRKFDSYYTSSEVENSFTRKSDAITVSLGINVTPNIYYPNIKELYVNTAANYRIDITGGRTNNLLYATRGAFFSWANGILMKIADPDSNDIYAPLTVDEILNGGLKDKVVFFTYNEYWTGTTYFVASHLDINFTLENGGSVNGRGDVYSDAALTKKVGTWNSNLNIQSTVEGDKRRLIIDEDNSYFNSSVADNMFYYGLGENHRFVGSLAIDDNRVFCDNLGAPNNINDSLGRQNYFYIGSFVFVYDNRYIYGQTLPFYVKDSNFLKDNKYSYTTDWGYYIGARNLNIKAIDKTKLIPLFSTYTDEISGDSIGITAYHVDSDNYEDTSYNRSLTFYIGDIFDDLKDGSCTEYTAITKAYGEPIIINDDGIPNVLNVIVNQDGSRDYEVIAANKLFVEREGSSISTLTPTKYLHGKPGGGSMDDSNYYTKGEVNTALANKADTATTYTKTEVDTALAAKANTATTYTKSDVDTALGAKADMTALTAHASDTVIHTTQAEKDAWNAKLDASAYTPTDLSNYYNKSEVDTALAGKANTATTYTKTEVDNALVGKADTATTYTKTEVDNALADKATKTELNTALASKADTATTYTKSEVNTALAAKADTATTYTKTEVDTALTSKADTATTYTKTEVDTALAAKANTATTYTKTEVDEMVGDVESLLASI